MSVQILDEKIRIIEERKLNGVDVNVELDNKNDSFIDRLLKISYFDKSFTLKDVISETNTILVGVSLGVLCIHLNS